MIQKETAVDSSIHSVTISTGKAICIILMVIGHSGCPEALRAWIYTFHMPFFFFISGYCFKEKYLEMPKAFVKKRLKSLWWPFVKWELLFLLLHNLFVHFHFYEQSYTMKEIGIKTVCYLYMFGGEELLGGFWFLRQLLLASLIGWCIIKIGSMITKHDRHFQYNHIMLIVGVGILLIFNMLSYKYNIRIPFVMNKLTFLSALFYLSGYLYKLHSPLLKKWILPLLLGITVVASVVCPVSMLKMESAYLLPYIMGALSGCLLTLMFSQLIRSRLALCMDYIGRNTMTILVWHFLVFKLVSSMIIKMNNLPIQGLSEFPVMTNEAASGWWIVYALIGISIPILLNKVTEALGRKIRYDR